MPKKNTGVGKAFYEARARSLATIYLTRRDDLLVTKANEDDLVDLEVLITHKNAGNRKFGVALKSTKTDVTANQANGSLKPWLEAHSEHAFSNPVCLFFFRMENDRGYYTWVAEPIIT